jgi:Ca2+-binding RTX toxin-like protein
VWYSFTPKRAGWIAARTQGSNYDPVLSVYTGTRRDLNLVDCERYSGVVHFEAVAGEKYHFMVSKYYQRGGDLVFRVARSGLPCYWEAPTILGTSGDDVIEGTSKKDVIRSFGGDDTITGNGGSDIVCGGGGNDVIRGANRALGSDGDDVIKGGLGHDHFIGGAGDDVMRGFGGYDTLQDLEGENELYGGAGPHGDDLRVGRSTGVVAGGKGAGTDTLYYSSFESHPQEEDPHLDGVQIDLAAGTALVEGLYLQNVSNIEYIIGTMGADSFDGSDEDDSFYGMDGNDVISGAGGDDYLSGLWGNDALDGGAGNDDLYGGADTDSCVNGENVFDCEG